MGSTLTRHLDAVHESYARHAVRTVTIVVVVVVRVVVAVAAVVICMLDRSGRQIHAGEGMVEMRVAAVDRAIGRIKVGRRVVVVRWAEDVSGQRRHGGGRVPDVHESGGAERDGSG
jgi:hypothetical protein